MSAPRPQPNRSPSILVTDARTTPITPSTQAQPPSAGPAPQRLLPPRRFSLSPRAPGSGNGHRYTDISVGNLLFDHGASDIPSSRHRTSPPPPAPGNFAPYSTFERRRTPRGSGGYEDMLMQMNPRQRDPRLVVSTRGTDGNISNQRRQRRRRQEYQPGDEPPTVYRDLPSEEEDSDEEDDPYKYDKVIYLPLPPSPPSSPGLTASGNTSEPRRVTAFLTAEGYHLGKITSFLTKNHGVKGARVFAAGSPDAALYVPYGLPLFPGRSACRIRSGGEVQEVIPSLIDKSDDPDASESNNDYTDLLQRKAELFVFAYGVMVFWNFTETQERDILADITFADNDNNLGIITKTIPESDRETEEFRFEYSLTSKSPRISNDMMTLRATVGNADIKHKLTMSHGIAQSTKLSYFETKMENITMMELESVPKHLALQGSLGKLTREDIMKIEGSLFKLRVDVNLSSSVLDVPEFFWDEEPEMHAFYTAIREYLEIKQRIKVLNQRCKVFLDLADILADSIAETNMSRITWIIIGLIVLSLMVTTLEIIMRFETLSKLRSPAVRESNQ
ncbi:hypothetical protein POJ06DRAFT_241918 [Lipomyces tetrasporus]|uniref:DUF155 domain-containing protein n=1 Tax=Lipomyces tetrasporus TaxID=54092 RepID=A0AAD7VVY3_9ASCO|nr:uncharacterized protein POJ06DRAFT_241918 [Lipomyces tetrasporus]KAJ8103449.1 hypothetical protein POJ06DRAFT_241918 [Lipomyces tetrasporus]